MELDATDVLVDVEIPKMIWEEKSKKYQEKGLSFSQKLLVGVNNYVDDDCGCGRRPRSVQEFIMAVISDQDLDRNGWPTFATGWQLVFPVGESRGRMAVLGPLSGSLFSYVSENISLS